MWIKESPRRLWGPLPGYSPYRLNFYVENKNYYYEKIRGRVFPIRRGSTNVDVNSIPRRRPKEIMETAVKWNHAGRIERTQKTMSNWQLLCNTGQISASFETINTTIKGESKKKIKGIVRSLEAPIAIYLERGDAGRLLDLGKNGENRQSTARNRTVRQRSCSVSLPLLQIQRYISRRSRNVSHFASSFSVANYRTVN